MTRSKTEGIAEDKMADKKPGVNLSFKIGAVFIILMLAAGGFAGFKIGSIFYKNKQPEITAASISQKIQNASELTTAELVYDGLLTYTDGDIPLLTQKGFSMTYSAKIRAGIDFSKIDINITKDAVVIDIPEAQIQSVNVDPGSIEFYDERRALFNWTKKDDISNAVLLSEEDAAAHANTEELLKRADGQIRVMLEGMLEGSIGGRKLVIQ